MKSAMKKFVLIALIAIMLVCLCGCDSSDYKEACSLMESGDYAAAVEIFTALGDYKDSAAKISECETGILENEYKSAVALMEEGKYSNAIDIFSSIDYKDSAAKIAECETAIAEQKYNEALALMAEENYHSTIQTAQRNTRSAEQPPPMSSQKSATSLASVDMSRTITTTTVPKNWSGVYWTSRTASCLS